MKRKNASRQRAEQRAIAVLRDVLGAERFGEWLLNGFVELGEFILVAPNNKQAYRQGYPGGFPPFLYLYGIDDTGVLVLYGFQTDLRLLEDALAQLVLWAESRPEKLRRIACLSELPWSLVQSKLPRRLHTALTRMWLSGLKRVPPQDLAPWDELWFMSDILGLDSDTQLDLVKWVCTIRNESKLLCLLETVTREHSPERPYFISDDIMITGGHLYWLRNYDKVYQYPLRSEAGAGSIAMTVARLLSIIGRDCNASIFLEDLDDVNSYWLENGLIEDTSLLPIEVRRELVTRQLARAASYNDYEKTSLLSELLALVGDCPDLQSQIRTELTACRIRKAISLNAREKKELAALVKHCPEMVEIVDDLDLMDVAELVRGF